MTGTILDTWHIGMNNANKKMVAIGSKFLGKGEDLVLSRFTRESRPEDNEEVITQVLK